jgi:O-antigen/teichoic acid export membrane protein
MQPEQTAGDQALGRLVAKNTFYLTASQALTVPIAILVNAALARFLGPATFGFIYLASALSGFGFLIVNWGHENALPALIARDRGRAGALLGSSIAWRVGFSVLVYALLALGCMLLRYGPEMQWALGLTFVITGFASLIGACKDTIRGFERTDIPAYVHVGQQFLTALCVVPTLFLGGRLRMSLFVQIPVSALVLVLIWRTLRPVGVGGLSFHRTELNSLMKVGTPFVFLGLATALQPNINAVFLSKLVPSEVMGWFAVSWKLIGVLLFPAAALVGALYPTLCRLFSEDLASFVKVSRGAFSSVALLSVPIAMGCYLYPEIGVSMFSRKAFAAAEDNLRYLALYLFLLYFSMPLGTCVLAAGRQRAFSVVQALCVAVSAILDPLLIPYYQRHSGNGGLGVCAAAVVSEAMVVGLGIALTPRGVFDRSLWRSLLLSAFSGALMALAAWLMRPVLSPFIAAPLSVVVYGACALLTGAVDKVQLEGAQAAIARKFSRGHV